ncbi:unnamed protein product [Cylicocyclus nassatus]|uniref:Apple domain-containing protein n=1 Tax=Cylicocyclus nassatus TaxID=53992 RepID=A0AA36MCV4_CYLNA|nr:unnamed protein product [Cylicocyclus nassatus]
MQFNFQNRMNAIVTSTVLPTTSSSSTLTPSTADGPVSSLRVLYPIMLFLSVVSSTHASGRCFNTEKGLSIEGGDYRRLRGIDHRSCAIECRDDPSCLAYEWGENEEVCYLKSRSLSGDLMKKEDSLIGFCLDEEDELRDRFRDHVVAGPELASLAGLDGEQCKDACFSLPEAAIYTWSPDDLDDDDATIGTCKCLGALRSIKLMYNSFSGFLGPRKRQLRQTRHSPAVKP